MWVKNRGWSIIFLLDVGVGKLLLVKHSQTLRNWIKNEIKWNEIKSSFFFSCKFLCLLHQSICFYLKRANPSLEFRIKFNRYSMKSVQSALVAFCFQWVWLNVYAWNTLSIPPNGELSYLGGRVFSVRNHIFFQFPFWHILEYI